MNGGLPSKFRKQPRMKQTQSVRFGGLSESYTDLSEATNDGANKKFEVFGPLSTSYMYVYIHAFRKQPTVGQTKGLRLLPHRLETTKPGANKNVKVFGPLSEANIYIYVYRHLSAATKVGANKTFKVFGPLSASYTYVCLS